MSENTEQRPDSQTFAREEDLLDAIRNSEWESLRRKCEDAADDGWG